MSFLGNMAGKKALTAHSKGEYAKAIQLYEEAYAKGMDQARLLRAYSILLIRTNQFDKALEVIKKMEKTPGLTDKDRTDMHMNYAIILWKKGHLDRCMQILEDDFRHTKYGALYSTIGYLKIEQGNPDEALRFNQEALEYDDADPVFLDNMGQTYYRLIGDKDKAKEFFDRAIAAKPDAIDTNYFLALYAIEEGDVNRAKEHLKTARKGLFSPLNYATPELIDEKLASLNA